MIQEAIERDVTRIAKARTGERPASLRVTIKKIRSGDERLDVLVLEHRMLDGTAYASPGMPDAVGYDGLTEAGVQRVSDAVDDMARRLAREEARTRIGPYADAHRPWLEDGKPPSWTLISHPLMVHALMRAGANDLHEVTTTNATPGPGVRVKRLQDLLVGSCPIDPLNTSRGKVFCDDMGLVMVIDDDIPHVARTALLGRHIGSLIELPPCGDDELDMVVERLVINDIDDALLDDRAGVSIGLSPAPWVACAPAPHRVDTSWMMTSIKTC